MRRIQSGLLLFCLITAPVAAQTNAEAEALATRAHQALLLQRYPEAASAFADEEAMLRQGQLAGVDAAIYWQAFVALKQRRQAEVRRQVERLLKEFPNSVWVDDARALLPDRYQLLGLLKQLPSSAEIRNEGSDGDWHSDRAIDAILSLDATEARVRLQGLIENPSTEDLFASRALYALNVIAPTDAQSTASKVLKQENPKPQLEQQALVLLAMSTDTDIQTSLRQHYASLSAPLRTQLLNAWATADQLQNVRAALEQERDADVRWQGINALAVLRDADSLTALVRAPRVASDRLIAINGLAVMEQGDTLIALLDEPALAADKLSILRSLGTAGGTNTPARLVKAYAEPDLKQRQVITDALAALNAGEALLGLLKTETDPASRVLLMTAIRRLHDPALLSQAEALVTDFKTPR